MSKSKVIRILGLAASSGMLVANLAKAEAPLGIVPATVCQPIDKESASDFLRNSAGTFANMSPEHAAWVQCPIRMPGVVSPGQTLEWRANFLTTNTEYCVLRVATLDGEIVGSILQTPTSEVQLTAPIGDYGVSELIASVRCKLPPSDPTQGPAGITTFRARVY